MKRNRRLYLIAGVVALSLAIALIFLRGGRREMPANRPPEPERGAPVTGIPEGGAGAARGGDAAATAKEREERGKSPRKPQELRPAMEIYRGLAEQAREIAAKGLGGASDETRSDLLQRVREIDADLANGRGMGHRAILIGMAALSEKLDRMDSYDALGWRAEVFASFERRLAEVNALADDAPVGELIDQWWRGFTRDDESEAILLRLIPRDVTTKEELQRRMESLVQMMKPVER